MSAANAVRSQSASNTPTDSMTRTASAEPVWMESVRMTTSAAAKAALRRPPSGGRCRFCPLAHAASLLSPRPHGASGPDACIAACIRRLVRAPTGVVLSRLSLHLRTKVVHFPDSEDDMSARPKTPTHADEKPRRPVRPPHPGEQLRCTRPGPQAPRRRACSTSAAPRTAPTPAPSAAPARRRARWTASTCAATPRARTARARTATSPARSPSTSGAA